jgi:hypothetical protein
MKDHVDSEVAVFSQPQSNDYHDLMSASEHL